MQKWLAIIVFFLNACTDGATTRHTEWDGKPLPHAIESAQLRELMDRMDILMQESFMTEYEVDSERRKYALRIAANAEHLSKTVTAITHLLPSLKLNEEDQHTFLTLANTLGDQARVLETQAQQNQIDAIGNSMRHISVTCASCHSLFRKPKQ
ncbi:MAG: hypothetical protein ACU837_16165 [Gammaproteobacteria bacterium]